MFNSIRRTVEESIERISIGNDSSTTSGRQYLNIDLELSDKLHTESLDQNSHRMITNHRFLALLNIDIRL